MVLRGETEDLQIGAFLMLLRVKEETPEELAGFVEACRGVMSSPPDNLSADLDWSSYAGKKHQHPWFILSMLLLRDAGYRVFVHGAGGHTPGRLYTEAAMRELGLPLATDWAQVDEQLDATGLSYLPLSTFCQPLQELIQLRPLLGLRSPVNTLTRMLNPLHCRASLQSIFHPAYGRLHQEADRLLGQPAALVFKGDSGEVEIKPQADTRLQLLCDGKLLETLLPRTRSGKVDSVSARSVAPLRTLWRGDGEDNYGLEATLATTAVALSLLETKPNPATTCARAEEIWQARDRAILD
jgi:anthranilate phosphoribosyltransferase